LEFAHLKAVSFDAGGTLIKPWPSVGHVYSAVAAEAGYPGISAEKLNEAFARAWRAKEGFDYSRSAWFALVEEVFATGPRPEGPGARPEGPKLFDSLYQRFTQGAAWHVYEDVRPTLQTLRERGYRLAVISNWDDRLKPLLADLRLSDYFETIVLSVDVGATKPWPKIFDQTLKLLNVSASELLHVGDSLEEDLVGPQQCGIAALLLDRKRKTSGSLPLLTDLLSLLPRARIGRSQAG